MIKINECMKLLKEWNLKKKLLNENRNVKYKK